MNQKKPELLKPDLRRLFLTPPNTRKEQITLLVMLTVTFILFFGPVCFSSIPPLKAVLISCFPALTTSWGWLVLLRFLFRKKDFCKQE